MGVLNTFLAGGAEFAHQKNCMGVLPGGGGWSGLELTDTSRELCLQLLSTVKLAMTQMTIIDLFSKYLVYIDELSRKSFDFEIIFVVKIQRR